MLAALLVFLRHRAVHDDIVPGENLSILSGDKGRREGPQEIVLYIRNPSSDNR